MLVFVLHTENGRGMMKFINCGNTITYEVPFNFDAIEFESKTVRI